MPEQSREKTIREFECPITTLWATINTLRGKARRCVFEHHVSLRNRLYKQRLRFNFQHIQHIRLVQLVPLTHLASSLPISCLSSSL